MQKIALKTAGTIFFVVGVLHGWRILTKVDVMWGTTSIPASWSIAGLAIAFSLSVWMFYVAKK